MKMSESKKTILAWVFLITLGSLTGISIIFRDVSNGFGTVTFGSIAPFELQTNSNEIFSSKELSGRVWVGHTINDYCTAEDECISALKMFAPIYEELKGDDDVKILSFMINESSLIANMYIQSLPSSNNWEILVASEDYEKHLNSYMNYNSSNAFIVDQNGIIRGIYDIQSKSNAKQLIEDLIKLI
jgi:cytochrome oxidase Cu insertion factor (SCO1/SenC/PrrC family)